ncbi:potassium channel subfamily T member 2, partial [Biomphalaria glabrata]
MEERVNCGGDYSLGLSKIKKHVIVCSTTLSLDSLIDFLNEFYGNPNLEVRPLLKYRTINSTLKE